MFGYEYQALGKLVCMWEKREAETWVLLHFEANYLLRKDSISPPLDDVVRRCTSGKVYVAFVLYVSN